MKKVNKKLDYYLGLKYSVAVVPYSDDDFEGYRAYFLDIPAIETIGSTREEALNDLDEVKREWFSYAVDEGVKIPEPNPLYEDIESWSGRVTLRIPKSLHRRVAEYAQLEGMSLNSYLNMAIERGIYD